MHEELNPESRFDRALREWAASPAPTKPEVAAAKVRARLDWRAPAGTFPALTCRVATALGVALLAGFGLYALWDPPRSSHGLPGDDAAVPPLPANVMVFWLDRDTPVYFVTDPERPGEVLR
jgi:hypothetical protein